MDLRRRVLAPVPPTKGKASAKPTASVVKGAAKGRKAATLTAAPVSPLRASDVAARGGVTAASTAKLAPFLDPRHPDRKDVCQLFGSLSHGSGGGRDTLKMTEHALAPLLALAPDEPAARNALASAAASLRLCPAYPEALACIEALLPFAAEAPWAQRQFRLPWSDQRPETLTGPRQLALLELYRAECLVAVGEAALGEEAFRRGFEQAERAELPSPMQLTASTQQWGTLSDFRIFALTRAARALRWQLLGKDVCYHRKLSKSEQLPRTDPAKLATATRYAEIALEAVAARAPGQYAGLTPSPSGQSVAKSHYGYGWQWQVYLEAALLDELNGNTSRARHRVGQAKFLAALYDPTHEALDQVPTLLECAARLGAVDTPLDAVFSGER